MTMQRVPNAAFDPALEKRLEALWGKPVNLYKALANHPAFVGAWTEFAQSLRADTKTPRALRELMILRSGQVQKSEYEWAQHLRMARKAGVREAQIEQLADWRASVEFNAQERAALGLLEGVTAGRVDDAAWDTAAREFSREEMVELVMVAGFYSMVARVLDALRVELDDDIRDYAPRLPG
jgi:alkylhydroperoxidase family enzyme